MGKLSMRSFIESATLAGLVAAAAADLAAGPRAQAQEQVRPADEALQEVVVTAERRAARLQDVPVSVTAFTQEKLDSQGLRSIDDVARLTPGLTFQRMGLSAASNYNDENSDIAIRGVDSSAGASTTGIYVDDTPIQTRHLSFGSVNAFPALFDLERVEVLRGPQGTLFGAGSEGGTVRFIAPEPGLHEDTGYVRSELATTQHGDQSYELGAAAGGPIIEDKLGFRVSASFRRDGGYVDRVDYRNSNVTEPNANWQLTVTVRGALKFAVTDTLTLSPSLYYQSLKINDTGAYWPSLSDPNGGVFRNGDALRDQSRDPFYLAALKAEWSPGPVHVISTTSYFARSQSGISDYTQAMRTIFLGNPLPPLGDAAPAFFTDRQVNFVEELRVQSADPAARFNWVAGIFFTRARENTTETVQDPTIAAEFLAAAGFPLTPAQLPGGILYFQDPFQVLDRQVALYGQGDLKLTDAWKLTLGLRVADTKTTGTEYYAGTFVGPTPVSLEASTTEHPVTPKIGISFQPDRNNLFYASAAKGYRIGGVNAQLSSLCATDLGNLGLTAPPANFSSDSLWSYELGAKNSFLGGRMQVNSSVFYIDWKNIQQNVYLASCGLQFTGNLGSVVSKGADLELNFRATESLLLGLSLGYTDPYYRDTVHAGVGGTGAPVVTSGDHLAGAPWNIQTSAEYEWRNFEARRPYVRVDYQVATAQRDLIPLRDPNNGGSDPSIPGLPETKSLSLRAGLRWNGFDVSLFGNNLLDTHPLLFRSHDTVVSPLYYDHTWRPRTLGVTATYRY